MEFKTDRTYSFPELMAYGFTKHNDYILVDCHVYLGENSFDAMLYLSVGEFFDLIAFSDDKSGAFESACKNWQQSADTELFLPDLFPDPVHCKIKGMTFRYVKVELEQDEFGEERIFHFQSETLPG
jgi:hypothetical protein